MCFHQFHKPRFTDEWKNKLSDSAKSRVKRDGIPFKGCKHSEETKRKMRENRPDTSGDKNPFYGKKHSQEIIEKSIERAIKMFRGIEKSEEHKKKKIHQKWLSL